MFNFIGNQGKKIDNQIKKTRRLYYKIIQICN